MIFTATAQKENALSGPAVSCGFDSHMVLLWGTIDEARMTRTDAALAAVTAELELWRRIIEAVPGLRSLMLVAKFDASGAVRAVIVSPEGGREIQKKI